MVILMYSFFKGTVSEKFVDKIILEVNNIGYEIYMPESDIEILKDNQEIKIYTHLHVREDEMKLFGFLTEEKLNFFKKLISVSGVGPKAATTIISNIPVTDMCVAIATENLYVLKKIPGIGPKMAQKIILELKDKVLKDKNINLDDSKLEAGNIMKNKNVVEATTALEALGFSYRSIEQVMVELGIKNESVEEIIVKVLNKMQR